MNESSAAVFAEDFEDYEFQVADSNACPVCKALNGKKFKFSQRVPGRNFPPMHPWCRCHYGVAVADWDKWQDEYVKKYGGDVSQKTLNDLSERFELKKKANISDDVIRNIKSFHLDELTWRENEQLRAAAQKLLKQVKKLPEDTECLYYYDMHMNFLKLAVGKAGANKVAHTYKPQFDYIVIHNHPDNATLSPGDLKQLIDDDFLQIVIAVGNDGKQYSVSKSKDFAKTVFAEKYLKYAKSLLSSVSDFDQYAQAMDEFLKTEAIKYGLKYKKI